MPRITRHNISNIKWQAVVGTLVRTLEEIHPYTRGHSQRVQHAGYLLARQLGWSNRLLTLTSIATILHDVGKITINSAVLNHVGELEPEQRNVLINHPYHGARMIAGLFPNEVIDGVFQHHERVDGQIWGEYPGYPFGLKGAQITPIARLISICDSFDAMTTKRTYNDPVTPVVAGQRILKAAGSRYDPKMAKCFVRHIVPQL
jgi:HD-GYP domain-containing protein (c-di-GMP phosphodiesterase class II)